MEMRRSKRVADKAPATPSPSAVSTRTSSRTLRSRNKGEINETAKTDPEGKMEFEDMETQVVTLEDCGTDVSSNSKLDKDDEQLMSRLTRGKKDKNKNKYKKNDEVVPKVEDSICRGRPSQHTAEQSSTTNESEPNPETESETAESSTAPEDEGKNESEDESKTAFLGMAFGLRKSPSSSPNADKKPVNRTEDVSKSETTVKFFDNNDEAAQPPSNPPAETGPSSAMDNAGVKSTENDSNKTSEGDPPQPQAIPLEEGATPLTSAAPVGNLRSSAVDAEAYALAKRYRRSLKNMETYSLDYICKEIHHPVISCFRELSRADVSQIVGSSKLKKSFNSLEQSVLYLGLIDLMATANNNPFYGENYNAKFSKNVSGMVQRILLEFKNIIGMWALSGNDQLNTRYSLIIKYLRALVPFFNKAGFDQEFSSILDCIEKEVTRLKSNHDKLKTMGFSSTTTASSIQSSDSQDQEVRSTLGEIFLNVSLNVKEDVSDDEDDVAIIKEEESTKIFGKPLKASPRTIVKRKKKDKQTVRLLPNDLRIVDEIKPVKKKPGEVKIPKSHVPTSVKSLSQSKTLSPSPSTSSSKPPSKNENTVGSAKRSANEELQNYNEANKKRKLDASSSPVSSKEKTKTTIKSFFQIVSSSNTTASSPKPGTASTSPESNDKSTNKPTNKPAVNAFAIMMKRSREIAQQKKLAAAPSVTALTVDMAKA